jgi:Tol biopolymer transport system component
VRRAVACFLALGAAALAGPAAAGPGIGTTRVTISTSGVQANEDTIGASLSGDGRLVAFYTRASNLVPHDTNNAYDVFVRDRKSRTTSRVSVSSSGGQGNGDSVGISLSRNGRFVAFYSFASNLVGGDTNRVDDAFVRDLKTERTIRVSVSSRGAQANGPSFPTALSNDGRFVVFESDATNLVPGDSNLKRDVFVRDMKKHTTTRVSVSSSGAEGDDTSRGGSISGNGRLVAFHSDAQTLVRGDGNGVRDVFVRDLMTHVTSRISLSTAGVAGNLDSKDPSISANGRYVTFVSSASNLVAHDANNTDDIFIRDLKARTTKLVSVSSSGVQGNGVSFFFDPAISADGRYVVFSSDATNLVAGGDTNGFPDDYIRDIVKHTTQRVSVSSTGAPGNGGSEDPAISADGRWVSFPSNSSNFAASDTNAKYDIYVRGPLH